MQADMVEQDAVLFSSLKIWKVFFSVLKDLKDFEKENMRHIHWESWENRRHFSPWWRGVESMNSCCWRGEEEADSFGACFHVFWQLWKSGGSLNLRSKAWKLLVGCFFPHVFLDNLTKETSGRWRSMRSPFRFSGSMNASLQQADLPPKTKKLVYCLCVKDFMS